MPGYDPVKSCVSEVDGLNSSFCMHISSVDRLYCMLYCISVEYFSIQNGVTALHRAVIDGHADVVRVLLKAGCSVDNKDEVNEATVLPAELNVLWTVIHRDI